MKIDSITKEQFDSDTSIRVLIEEDYADYFYVIQYEDHKIGIALYGMVPPNALVLEKYDLLLIGGGQSVIGISIRKGIVKFGMGVVDSFSFFEKTRLGFCIVSENHILVINGENLSFSQAITVPDIIMDCKIDGDKFIITGLDTTYEI